MRLHLLALISFAIICIALPAMAAGTLPDQGCEFFVNQTIVVPGEMLQFNGTGPKDVVWNWDFGDGGNSELTDPVYSYDKPGTYTVTATVSSGDSVSVIRKEDLVTVITESEVIHVPGDASTIQAGIANAQDGTAVIVDGGEHEGPVVIDRPIALYGNTIDGERPILTAGYEESALVLSGPGSRAMGFAIEGAGEVPSVLINAGNTTVSDLQVTGGSTGIMVQDASGAAATACSIEDAGTGILADSSPGTVISRNDINGSHDDGICISNTAVVSVSSNTISGAKSAGIALRSAKSCMVSENVIDGCGPAFDSVLGDGNTFWLNVISGGTGAPFIRGSVDHWNATVPVIAMIGSVQTGGYAGNYWEGYQVADADGDGFLDEPYWIDTANIDYHPLASAPVPLEGGTVPVVTTVRQPAMTQTGKTTVTAAAAETTALAITGAATPAGAQAPVSWLIPFTIAAVIAVAAIVVYYTRFRHQRDLTEEREDQPPGTKTEEREEIPPPVRIEILAEPVSRAGAVTAPREAAEAEARGLAGSGKGKEAAILLFREIVSLLDESQESAPAHSATPAEIGRQFQGTPYAALLKDFLNMYTTIRYRGFEPSYEEFEALTALFGELSAAISAA
jgi:parallel beta-helix repeat protein